jgi:hypothetical protein
VSVRREPGGGHRRARLTPANTKTLAGDEEMVVGLQTPSSLAVAAVSTVVLCAADDARRQRQRTLSWRRRWLTLSRRR